MAYGNNTYTNNTSLFFFTPRSMDKDKKEVVPHFEISKSVGDNFEKQSDGATEVSGDLVKVDFKEKEFNGVKTKRVYLHLLDKTAGERYIVDLNYRMSTRSLFNAISSLNTFDNLVIGIYRNKKKFEAFWIKQNGNRVEWKYKPDDLPHAKELMFQGRKMYDYSEVDEFYEKELTEVGTRINGLAPEVVKENSKTEDVPF